MERRIVFSSLLCSSQLEGPRTLPLPPRRSERKSAWPQRHSPALRLCSPTGQRTQSGQAFLDVRRCLQPQTTRRSASNASASLQTRQGLPKTSPGSGVAAKNCHCAGADGTCHPQGCVKRNEAIQPRTKLRNGNIKKMILQKKCFMRPPSKGDG